MKRLHVQLPRAQYDICVGGGLLEQSGNLIREIYGGKRAAVITDSNVFELYRDKLADSLSDVGIDAGFIVVAAGEGSKSAQCLNYVYDQLLDININRGELIIAFGGGVVGDLAGYAACTLLRGIPCVQIPTTLLAQVDSSVGGKVAINHARGKNLIGAFYQPSLVISDTRCLNTLNKRVWADGMAEVVKYGAIQDAALFSFVENTIKDFMPNNSIQNNFMENIENDSPPQLSMGEMQYDVIDEIVTACCGIKRDIVQQDERDTGIRMTLNFGHTLGHAVEKKYDYKKYTHGECVSIGMNMICKLGEKMGVTKPGTADKLQSLLCNIGLPTQDEINPKQLAQAVALDKKRSGDEISLILLKEIGNCAIHKISAAQLEEML